MSSSDCSAAEQRHGLLAARSQQRERSLIRLLAPGSAAAQADTINAVRQGLREMGFIDGKNIAIEVALAGGQFDNLPELAAGLVRLQAKAIIAVGVAATVAAKQRQRLFRLYSTWARTRSTSDS